MPATTAILPGQLWIIVCFIALFFFVIPFVSVFVTLLRYAVARPVMRILELPKQLTPLQQTALQEIEALDFIVIASYEIVENDDTRYGLILRHRVLPAYASLRFSGSLYAGYPVVFYSFLTDGNLLLTSNRVPSMLEQRKAEYHTVYTNNLAEHWQAHQDRGKEPLTLAEEEAISRIVDFINSSIEDFSENRQIKQDKNGNWFPSLAVVLRTSWSLMRVRKKLRKPYETPLKSQAHQSAYHAECYREQEVLKKRKKSRPAVTLTLLALSLCVSLGLWSQSFNLSFAVILIATLLVHECGHALAMRLFGYRDMSMFFIPFVGAIVMGEVKELPVWKQQIILLAGPLPGLLFGIYAVYAQRFTHSPLLYQMGIIAVSVNLFNLLPITPLDGGRLVEISLFARWPWAMKLFAVLSLCGITGLAIWLQQASTFVIAYFIFIYARSQFRLAYLRGTWKGVPGEDNELEGLFEIIQKKFGKLQFARQYHLARAVFAHRSINMPRLWEAALALTLLVAIWAMAGYAIYEWHRYTTAQQHFDQTYSVYADDDSEYGSAEQSAELKKLETAAAALDPRDPRQVDFLVAKSWFHPMEQQIALLQDILHRHTDGYYNHLKYVARSYFMDIHYILEQQGASALQRQKMLADALAKVDAWAPNAFSGTINARLWLAEAYDAQGQSSVAQAQLSALLARAKTDDNCLCELTDVARAQVWFYLDKHQPGQAIAFLEASPYVREMKTSQGRLGLEYAWALIQSGRTEEGLAQMTVATTLKPRINKSNTLPKPVHMDVMDLVYAYIQAGESQMAISLAQDNQTIQWQCKHFKERNNYFYSDIPWQNIRQEALANTSNAICMMISSTSK
jgi:Zn-dependent protease/predicted house-cleaning noncanonical NTP pyrophosphatase (MazG superfamily)